MLSVKLDAEKRDSSAGQMVQFDGKNEAEDQRRCCDIIAQHPSRLHNDVRADEVPTSVTVKSRLLVDKLDPCRSSHDAGASSGN